MREVRIAAVTLPHPSLAPDEVRPPGPEGTFDLARDLIQQAVEMRADFVCLPEIFAYFNTSLTPRETLEAPDGPAHTFLATTAREVRTNLVTTVYTRCPEGAFNRGVWYDRAGRRAGIYDKVHLAPGEEEVVQPGRDFPVYEIGGVKVGMQTCYDLNFPEGCRVLALRGAEIIFWPNLWGGMPEGGTEVMMRARAMENQVCLVSAACLLTGSGFFRVPKIHGRSCIVDWHGTIVAEVGLRIGVTVATLDFDEDRQVQVSHEGNLAHERRPETYGPLVGDHPAPLEGGANASPL
jgi:N-carbamoylputrescine amidase